MNTRLQQLRGGVAAVASMQGIGWPRIAFAPDDEKGAGDGGDGGSDGGDKGGEGGEGKGADGDGGKGDASKLGSSGLFSKRKQEGAAEGNGEGKAGDGKEPVKDGRPEGLPDKFWDATKKSMRTDDLAKAYVDLEKAHGTLKRSKSVGGEVPETADDYFKGGVELPKEVTNIPVPPDDPGLKAWGKVAHKYGIGKDAAVGIVKDILVEMNDQVAPPLDPDAEFEKLGKGGEALVDGVFVWADGLTNAGRFSEDDAEVIAGLSETASGIRFLAKIREMSGEQRIPIDPGTGKRGMSQEDWHDAYKEAVKKQDYKEQERLDGISASIFGTDPARSGRSGGYSSEKAIAR